MRGLLTHPAGDSDGIGVQRRNLGLGLRQRGADVDHLDRGQTAGLGFEQQVDGALAGLMASLNGTRGLGRLLVGHV